MADPAQMNSAAQGPVTEAVLTFMAGGGGNRARDPYRPLEIAGAGKT